MSVGQEGSICSKELGKTFPLIGEIFDVCVRVSPGGVEGGMGMGKRET